MSRNALLIENESSGRAVEWFFYLRHKRRFYHSCLEVDGLGSPASSGSDKVNQY